MPIADSYIGKLYKQFIEEFDQDGSCATWERQSLRFRNFWDKQLSQKSVISQQDINTCICFLDSHAKGIGDTEIEAACLPVIPQGSWYRIFSEFQNNAKLYHLVSQILRCGGDEEQIELLNRLYSLNTEKNRLTGKQATMINDLMFVYNPWRNLSVVSLTHRFKIMDTFGLGKSSHLKNKSWGEQIIFSKQALLGFQQKYPFKNTRALSRFFYDSEVKKSWDETTDDAAGDDSDFDERLEEEGFFEVPVGERQILTAPSDSPIESLCKKIDKNTLVVRPEFQRYYIWEKKPKLKSRLIESVLLRVPIPTIYTAEQEDGKELVVDGQQRLLTFYNFTKKDGFRLTGLRILKELNGKSYGDLDSEIQDQINEYPIRVIKILKKSHRDIKFDVFERLNRGSVKLNEQELRNSIYHGSFNTYLKDLVKNKDFQRLQGLDDVDIRMRDVERVLRFFAFSDLTERNYKGPLTTFLNEYMESRREISDKQKDEKTTLFKKSVELCQSVFGDMAFRRWYAGDEEDANGYREDKINEGILDIQMYAFTQYEKRDIISRAQAIREGFIDVMTGDRQFIESIEKGTYDKNRVVARTEKWLSRLREIVGYPEKDRRLFTFDEKKSLFAVNQVCHICGNEIAFIEDAHVDHLERYSEGGKTQIKNGKLSHRYCNLKKG